MVRQSDPRKNIGRMKPLRSAWQELGRPPAGEGRRAISPSFRRCLYGLGNPLVGNAKEVPGVSERDTTFNQFGGRFSRSADCRLCSRKSPTFFNGPLDVIG